MADEEKKEKHSVSIRPLSDKKKEESIEILLGISRMVETKPGEFCEARLPVEDLKINRELLQQVSDKYGAAYAYDVFKLASLNPKLLMRLALKGHEEEFNYNQIAQEFLANKESINTDKALQFFAEAPISLETLDHIRTRIEMSESRHFAEARLISQRKKRDQQRAKLLAEGKKEVTRSTMNMNTNVNTIDTNVR